MGRFQNRTLFYWIVGAVFGLTALLGYFARPTMFTHQDPALFGDIESISVPRINVKATWTKIPHDSSGAPGTRHTYTNDYKPNTSYASSPGTNGVIRDPGTPLKAPKTKKKKVNKKKTGLSGKSSSTNSKRNNKLSASGGGGPNIGGGVGGGGASAKKDKKPEEENLNTVEFWQKPIFEQQDPAALTKLIDAYQGKKVSNGVFYEVVDEMSHDERPLLRDFGLTALTATPSTKSFDGLAWMKNNEPESAIRTGATREVASYSETSQLGFVVSALRLPTTQNEGVTAIEAMRVLTVAAKQLDGNVHAQGTDPKTVHANAANQTLLEQRMTQALNIIKGQLVQSSNPAVKAEAAKTLAALTKLVAAN